MSADPVYLRRQWGLPRKANVRDHLTTEQLNTIIQIERTITLQLEARRITNPADQLRVVRHVALSYRNILDTPLPSGRSVRTVTRRLTKETTPARGICTGAAPIQTLDR
jgi:hypothetical protein